MSVLDRLVMVNWLEPEMPANPMKPVKTWLVNPTVYERFEGYGDRERERRQQAREAIEAAKLAASAEGLPE